MDARDREEMPDLAAFLAARPEIAGTLDFVWRQARASFGEADLERWIAACRALAEDEQGAHCLLAYVRSAPVVAATAGPAAALDLAKAAPRVARSAGAYAGVAFVQAAPKAARRLRAGAEFAEWLEVMQRTAEAAPESVTLLLDRIERILTDLDVRSFGSWVLGGIRAAAGDPERRMKFFALLESESRRRLAHEGEGILFVDIERQLKAFLKTLWRQAPPLRALSDGAFDRPRRTTFGGGIVRVPDTFRGVTGEGAISLYRAALAHIGAHLRFSRAKFPVGSLKPVQAALVSLIEDARVERLAIAEFPGLMRLWLPFHVAEPAVAFTAPSLMARLARALLDPAYEDDNSWVGKGRAMFAARLARLEDPGISREIGGLLGNDLGQMRAQFNAKSYAVEPVYRDDNQGLWELPESASTADETDTVYEGVRFDRADPSDAADRQREGDGEAATSRATIVPAELEVGVPVARYAEWDYLIGRDRAEWATLVEYDPIEGRPRCIDDILERREPLLQRIRKLIRAAKVSRPVRLRRQPEGDRLDLDACIATAIDRRLGRTPDHRVYGRLERHHRDLSVLLLLDVSHSTNDIVARAGTSVLELEREAAALMAHAMEGLGDPFAIRAFCSDTRADVRYYRVKDFETPYDAGAKARLAGLTGRFSTRMGAAIRHAGRELARQPSYRRLLIVISDGEPSDIDVADRRYLVEDARHAVMSLSHLGVDVFCVGLDAGGDSYLERIFGRRNVVQVDRVERLPERLPMLYLRLTA